MTRKKKIPLTSFQVTSPVMGIRQGARQFNSLGQSPYNPPENAAGFQVLGLAVPDYLWLCQDASGDLAATIGTALTNQGAGTHVFQQSVAGWNRKAIGSLVDNEVTNWRFAAGAGPIPSSSNSVAWLAYFQFPSLNAGNRIVSSIASQANAQSVQLLTTGLLRANATGGDVNGTYNYVDGQVHPIVLSYNRSTSTFTIFTDKERINGVFTSTPSDSNKGIGSTGATATGLYRCLWLCAFNGTNAEQDWRTYLSKLGWTMNY